MNALLDHPRKDLRHAPDPAMVTVFSTLADAEPSCRAIEAYGVLTPYQRFDWITACVSSGLETGRLAIAVIGALESPLAVLPMAVDRHLGVRRARLIGSAYANADWVPIDPAASHLLDKRLLETVLRRAGATVGGIDYLSLSNMPRRWGGIDNPLAGLAGQAAPSHFYATELGSVTPFIDHRLVTKLRSNLKRGRRRLEENFGPVRLERVTSPEAFATVHQVFLKHRGLRFDEMGIESIFDTPEMTALFEKATLSGLDTGRPAMLAHALWAGEEIVATSFGVLGGRHFSQYINATAPGPASKYSLSGILIGDLIDDLIGMGVTSFDMGLGDFAYKTDWTAAETVYSGTLPVTASGRIAVALTGQVIAGKRLIKQNEHLWAVAKNIRHALFRLRHGKSAPH